MADIYHTFTIRASAEKVFQAITTPDGLKAWWAIACKGRRQVGETYEFDFGPQYQWKARVIRLIQDREFELQMTESDYDWNDTRLCFTLQLKDGITEVSFHHKGWPEVNEHFRISSFCWAMYLRLLKRYVENGEVVPYDRRLEV